MKAKLLFLIASPILFMGTIGQSFGQSSGGIGFFTTGIHTIQYKDLNSSLPTGSPQITNKPLVTGGAGYFVFSNFVLGGETGTLRAGSFSRDDQVIDLSGDFGFFSLGYVVMNKKGILVYPLLSIGGNTLEMYMHQSGLNASYSAVTGEPFQATTLRLKSKMVKLSVSGLYTIQGSKSEKGSAGLMIGLEAGYQMSYKPGVWRYDNGDISDGPEFTGNAFFIQLMIGGGGVMHR
jgi:hypothetical protein